MLLQSFTHLNAHILSSNKWNAERKDMICSKKWIKSPVFSQTSVFGSQHLWSMPWYKKKEGYLCLFVFICVFGVKASTTLQLVLGHSNLAKKKLACWVFKFELPLNHLDKLHSQTWWAWLQLHAPQIHWHQSSYWQIPFRSLKEDTQPCDTDCNLTALLPVVCKYV